MPTNQEIRRLACRAANGNREAMREFRELARSAGYGTTTGNRITLNGKVTQYRGWQALATATIGSMFLAPRLAGRPLHVTTLTLPTIPTEQETTDGP